MTTIIFDTETTGLIKPSANDLKDQPYIIEIFCLKITDDLDIIDEFETMIKPPVPITDEITKITGIREADVETFPEFPFVWRGLAKFFLGSTSMVAHNLAFDRAMLANELMRVDKVLNFPWPEKHICTVESSMHYEQRRLNLTRLHEYLFKKGFKDAHRARSDVMALYDCFCDMRRRGDV